MIIGIRETSRHAYRVIKAGHLLAPFQLEVYEIICQFGPLTGGEAWRYYKNKHPESDRGRNEVAKCLTQLKNNLTIREDGTRKCLESGFNNILWIETGNMPTAPTPKLKQKRRTVDMDKLIEEMRYDLAESIPFEYWPTITDYLRRYGTDGRKRAEDYNKLSSSNRGRGRISSVF